MRMLFSFNWHLQSKCAFVVILQKAIARLDRYGRREVVDNEWLTREVCHVCHCHNVCLMTLATLSAFLHAFVDDMVYGLENDLLHFTLIA